MIQTTRLGHIRGSAAGKNGAAIAVSMEVHRANQDARHTRISVEDLVLDLRGDR
jgi:hypothetical protein